MSNEKDPIIKGFESLLALVLLPLNLCFGGYVFMSLWNWHVVPFFGMRTIATHTAIGLTTIIGLLRVNIDPPKTDTTALTLVFRGWCIYSFALLVGYLAR
jgi:uncharacterized membrane protein